MIFCCDFCDFHKSVPCFFAVIFYCPYGYIQLVETQTYICTAMILAVDRLSYSQAVGNLMKMRVVH